MEQMPRLSHIMGSLLDFCTRLVVIAVWLVPVVILLISINSNESSLREWFAWLGHNAGIKLGVVLGVVVGGVVIWRRRRKQTESEGHIWKNRRKIFLFGIAYFFYGTPFSGFFGFLKDLPSLMRSFNETGFRAYSTQQTILGHTWWHTFGGPLIYILLGIVLTVLACRRTSATLLPLYLLFYFGGAFIGALLLFGR